MCEDKVFSHITAIRDISVILGCEGNVNNSGWHQPTIIKPLPLVCLRFLVANQQQYQAGNLPNHQSKLHE